MKLCKELRCSNWIQFSSMSKEQRAKGTYWVVEGVDLKREMIKVLGKWYAHQNIERIHLKGGWLQRLGFVEMKGDVKAIIGAEAVRELYREGIDAESVNGKPYIYSISSFRHLIYCKGFNMIMGYGIDELQVNPFPRVDSVHQVQNILDLFSYTKEQAEYDYETDKSELTEKLYG